MTNPANGQFYRQCKELINQYLDVNYQILWKIGIKRFVEIILKMNEREIDGQFDRQMGDSPNNLVTMGQDAINAQFRFPNEIGPPLLRL